METSPKEMVPVAMARAGMGEIVSRFSGGAPAKRAGAERRSSDSWESCRSRFSGRCVGAEKVSVGVDDPHPPAENARRRAVVGAAEGDAPDRLRGRELVGDEPLAEPCVEAHPVARDRTDEAAPVELGARTALAGLRVQEEEPVV